MIAFYDAKYTYNFWRPVTAIRAAATDGNPDTEADPNWLPEVGNTTPDPSYPGAHAVISAAGAEVLISFFHKHHFEFNVTSEVLPDVDRSFASSQPPRKRQRLVASLPVCTFHLILRPVDGWAMTWLILSSITS